MRKRIVRFAIGLVMALACGSPLYAQATGSITGQVVDVETLQPLPGAQVFIPSLEMGTLANQDGRFLMISVPAGEQNERPAGGAGSLPGAAHAASAPETRPLPTVALPPEVEGVLVVPLVRALLGRRDASVVGVEGARGGDLLAGLRRRAAPDVDVRPAKAQQRDP